MTATAQLEANRANALLSTGPRTPAGRARNALNGVRHGLTSRLPIAIRSGPFAEVPSAIDVFVREVVEALQPQTVQEHAEAERIAWLHIRLRRLPAIEAATISSSTNASVGRDAGGTSWIEFTRRNLDRRARQDQQLVP